MINKKGKYESDTDKIEDIINVKGDFVVDGNVTAETLLVDGSVFVSKNINVKTININGKIETKCVKANELKVSGSIVCDKIKTKILIINGQINCNSIDGESINLLLYNNNKIDNINGNSISIDKYKSKDFSSVSEKLKETIPFFRFVNIDGIYNKYTEKLNKETSISINEIDGREVNVNNSSVGMIIYDTLELGSNCSVKTCKKRERM